MDTAAVRATIDSQVLAGLDRFLAYRGQMIGTLTTNVLNPGPPTINYKLKLIQSLSQSRQIAMSAESTSLPRVTDDLLRAAGFDMSAPSAYSAVGVTATEGALRQLFTQLNAIQTQLQSVYSRTQIRASIEAKGVPDIFAITRAFEVEMTNSRFMAQDRIGRQYQFAPYIAKVYRAHFFETVVSAKLIKLAEEGEEVGVVSRPGHETDGTKFSVRSDTNTGLRSFADIRNEIFHPNSDALVLGLGEFATDSHSRVT